MMPEGRTHMPLTGRANVNGFVVYPLGNYHLEDVWLG